MPIAELVQLSESSLQQIRKTDDSPPMVSVLDVISVIKGCNGSTARGAWKRLNEAHPETVSFCNTYNFQANGTGTPTPVTTASGIARIIMLLPGKAAAGLRETASDLLVRYLGGDTTLVEEIYGNRQIQEQLPQTHPARIFGETVEKDRFSGIKMDIEEARLESQLKNIRIGTVTNILDVWKKYELPVDERFKIQARDMVASIGFDTINTEDPEVSIQEIALQNGLRAPGDAIALGRLAKQLYLQKHPGYKFQKKDIYCNGQQIQANKWTTSMKPIILEAVQKLKGNDNSGSSCHDQNILI